VKSRKGVSAALTIVITIVVLIVVALSVILIVTGGLGKFGQTVTTTSNPAACQSCVTGAKVALCAGKAPTDPFDATTQCNAVCKDVTGITTSGSCG